MLKHISPAGVLFQHRKRQGVPLAATDRWRISRRLWLAPIPHQSGETTIPSFVLSTIALSSACSSWGRSNLRIQSRVDHDSVDQVIHDRRDVIHAAQSIVERWLRWGLHNWSPCVLVGPDGGGQPLGLDMPPRRTHT